jgi:hypothetical protein
MFGSKKKLTALISGFALALSALAAATPAQAASDNGTSNGQTIADTANVNIGSWDLTTAGIAGRPYVTALTIGGTNMLSATPTGAVDGNSKWNSAVRAVVYASNSCKTGQNPLSGVCLPNPNAIIITLGYGDLTTVKSNFGHSDASSYGVTENTEIDMTVNLNSFSSLLGWTWLNGVPSYWKVDPIAKTVRIKFKPRYMPSSTGIDPGCITIPVSNCTTVTANSEMLQATMVLNVNNVVPLFSGALMASAGAVTGSLELPTSLNTTDLAANGVTYGISAPSNFATDFTPTGASTPGGVRKGSFYGFVPNTLLSTGFGLPDPAQASSLMSISRTSSTTATGTDAVTWATWDEATYGTAGQFVSITDITFSAPKFQLKRKAAATTVSTPVAAPAPVSVAKGKARAKKAILADVGVTLAKGEKATIKIAKSSKKICSVSGSKVKAKKKAGTCSYTVTVKNKKGKKVPAKTKSGSFTVR